MEGLEQFFKDNQRGYLRDPRRMAYAKLQKNTQGMDREQLEAFINANLFIPHSQYKMALGNLIQFLKKQDQVNKLNEVKRFQKIAGLLKENHSTPSTIKWNYPEVDTDSEDFYYEHNPESKDYSITVPVYGVGADGKNYKGSYTVNVPSLEGEVLDDLKVDPDEIYDVELVGEVNELHPDREWDEEDDEEDNGQDYPSDEELFGLSEEENEAGQIVNKVGDSLEAKLDQLTPEQIQKLQADLAKLGITADTAIEDAAEKIEGSLDEIEGDDKKKLANALQSIGTGLIGSLLVPIIPVAIGQGTGLGTATGLGITLAAGGLLVGLAKALKAKSDGTVNEDDYSEDPSSDMDDESQSGDTDAMNINEDEETKKRQEYAKYVNGFISQNEEDLNDIYETQGYLAALKVVRDKVAAILHNAGKYEYPTAGGGIGDNFPLVDAITRLFKQMGYKKK